MKPKIAILGGGIGGLAAAYALTDPDRGIDADVTVYQLGWRLGGKGASGRDLARGARIEEHGLHLWFGFYRNAFRMMADAYTRLPQDRPLHSVETAFSECETLTLWDRIKGELHPHRIPLLAAGGQPWDDEGELPELREIVEAATTWALREWRELLHWSPSGDDAAGALGDARLLAVAMAGETEIAETWTRLLEHLRRALRQLEQRYAGVLRTNPLVRLVYTTIDAFVAMAVGLVADVLDRDAGLRAIDDQEWTAWLRLHGASPEHTATEAFEDRAPLLRALYDVAFCFPQGRIDRANAAAGTATNDLLRLLFGFRGRLMYRMRAGMGDAIAAPLYEVLRARGVTFRFFCAVKGFEVQRGSLDAIDVIPQVPGAEDYDPLVEIRGVPSWPSHPVWDRLPADAEVYGVAYETELNPAAQAPCRLRCGKDFDHAVLAIPVGALPAIAQNLMRASSRFADMVAGSATVQSQAFQLWTEPTTAALGLAHGPGVVAAGFVEPLDTYCDMTHLLEREHWAGHVPGGVLYGRGVLADGEGYDDVRRRVRRMLETIGRHVWPRAYAPGFDWNVLFDPLRRDGPRRLGFQYLRANVTPWERSVITPAGSLASRLAAGESGFENLVLAGDWTRNDVDGGCVEAAVMSGFQAARALGADPVIHGEGTTWLSRRYEA